MRCSIIALLTILTSHAAMADSTNGRLDIHFIDVEGGAATLFITPTGESLLIDSGYPDNRGRDLKRIVATCRRLGLKQIDHAAVTHWHRDHYGNHAALTTKIPVRNFWDRGIPDVLREDKEFEARIADYRAATQNKSKTLRAGDALPLRGGKLPLSVNIVTASRNVISNSGDKNPFATEHIAKPRDNSDNAESLSFLLQFGTFKFLCCGDLTWNTEAKLVTPNNPLGRVDLFMVTHHGLPTSNNPALVLAIDPVVAVMCNGPTKGGHPDTMATLRRVKSMQNWYQLHRNIKLAADEQAPAEFIANTESTADCQGTSIHASIAPDGKTYTIQIGSGKIHTYQTRAKGNAN